MQQEFGFEGMFSAQLADSLAESAGEVEGAETNAGQRVSRVARAGAAGIIAQYGVEHVEAAILDVPATTQVFPQERGIGLVTRQAGDRVGHALPSLSFLDRVVSTVWRSSRMICCAPGQSR